MGLGVFQDLGDQGGGGGGLGGGEGLEDVLAGLGVLLGLEEGDEGFADGGVGDDLLGQDGGGADGGLLVFEGLAERALGVGRAVPLDLVRGGRDLLLRLGAPPLAVPRFGLLGEGGEGLDGGGAAGDGVLGCWRSWRGR